MNKISLPAYDPARCSLFALGRNAIYAACIALGLKEGDEVLTPAFDCDGALQPFRALGLKLKFFRSDPATLDADIADIEKRIGPRTRLLHIVQHFGMAQPWPEIAKIARNRGVPTLEDDAYSLFSSSGGQAFGSFGDMAIFSLRKNLPMADGGMLRVNDASLRQKLPPAGKTSFFYTVDWMNALRSIKSCLGIGRLPQSLRAGVREGLEPPPLPADPAAIQAPWPGRDLTGRDFSCDMLRPISAWSRMVLTSYSVSDFAAIAEAKRHYYKVIADPLSGLGGVRVLWQNLPEGAVPFCVVLLIERRRDEILNALRTRYDVMAWPTLSGAVIERLNEFPDVEYLGRRILQLNLSASRVRLPGFRSYAESLVRDLREML